MHGEYVKLVEETLMEGINDKHKFKAVFLAGGPGSGKSFVAEKAFKGTTARFVNSDIFFEHLLSKFELPTDIDPDNADQYAAQMVQRKKAKELASSKIIQYVDGMLPLIIDGTGRNYEKIKQQKEALEEIGYDTHLLFVNTSLDVAQERNLMRTRSVPEEIVKGGWADVQNNLGKFQNLFGNKMKIVDNSKTLDAKGMEHLNMGMAKLSMNWLGSKLENRHGRNIIDTLKRTKKKYLSDLSGIDISIKI